jgi:hypothetical protein
MRENHAKCVKITHRRGGGTRNPWILAEIHHGTIIAEEFAEIALTVRAIWLEFADCQPKQTKRTSKVYEQTT